MPLRSQTTAVIILLVTLGLVFVLVANAGVSTDVFLPDPTETPILPTATPLPEASAENWTETAPGQLAYTADPTLDATISYSEIPLETFAQQAGIDPPSADAEFPLLDTLTQMRQRFADEVESLGLNLEPGAFTPAALEMIEGVPFANFHLSIEPQQSAEIDFPGLDVVTGLVDRGAGVVTVLQYRLQGAPNPVVYTDFRAWLEANIADLTGTADADATEEPEAADEATEEAVEATEEPEAAATEAVEAADATEEPEAAATDEAAAAPEPAEGVAEAELPTWSEVMPGQLVYTADPNIFAGIGYSPVVFETFIEQAGLEMPAEDAENRLIAVLEQVRGQAESDEQVVLAEEDVEGPEMREYGGVPVAFLRVQVAVQTTTAGQAFPGQDTAFVLIESHVEGAVIVVQFILQGEIRPDVFEAFEQWLTENVAALVDAEPVGPQAAGPESVATMEAEPVGTVEAESTPEAAD